MAKKASTKKRARTAKATTKKRRAPERADPTGEGWGERHVPMLLAEHHVRVLEELGRQYGCVGPKGEVVLERVLREVLDRYGSVLLTVAQPRKGVDEEE